MFKSIRHLLTVTALGSILPISALANGPDYRLVDAMKSQDMATVKGLLRTHTGVNVARADGSTPLHWAAQWDELDIATQLVKAGANVNAKTDLGIAPLTLACQNGSPSMVDLLLNAGGDPNTAKSTGETLLMTCSRSGSLNAVKALLTHGANINGMEPMQGQNALMWAAAQGHADVVQFLIARGADIRATTKEFGYTPLLFASRNGATDVVKVLLGAGADVNSNSADGTTPLIAAVYTGHWDLAKFLLDHGADPNSDKTGYTALHWAAGSWENDISGQLGPDGYEWVAGLGPGKLDLVNALLTHGANPNARLRRHPPRFGYGSGSRLKFAGATPFILAALGANVDIMRALLKAGADPHLTTDDGTTALMTAAGYGRIHGEGREEDEGSLAAIKLCLDLGIDVNAANKNGDTALMGSTYYQMDPVVEFLLEKGANVNAMNRTGETPLVVAEGYAGSDTGGNTFYSDSTAAILKKAGASDVMKFDSVVKKLETSCPAITFLVADPGNASSGGDAAEYGTSLRIKPAEGFQFKNSSCADLQPGSRVQIVGTRLGHRLDKNGQPWDGSVDASAVEILK